MVLAKYIQIKIGKIGIQLFTTGFVFRIEFNTTPPDLLLFEALSAIQASSKLNELY